MPALLIKMLMPVVAGGLVAGGAVYGLVWSQNQAPSTNPVGQQILVYGAR